MLSLFVVHAGIIICYCSFVFVVDGFILSSPPSSWGRAVVTPSSAKYPVCVTTTLPRYAGVDAENENNTNNSNGESESDDQYDDDHGDESITPQRPNKMDLYAEDELADLLQLHSNLYPAMIESNNKDTGNDNDNNNDFPSLHDLVMQTIEDIEDDEQQKQEDQENGDSESSFTSSTAWMPESFESKLTQIQAIASDVDGTILDTKDQQVHPRTQQAITQAVDLARKNRETNNSESSSSSTSSSSLRWIFPATGKSRAGALHSLGPELASILRDGPGVYCQGLYCVGPDGKSIIFEKRLNKAAIEQTEQLVEFTGTSIIAYDGDELYTTDLNPTVIELHEKWGEPLSKEIDTIVGHTPGVHKILVCDNDLEKLRKVVRPQLEQVAAETGSVVTQAIPTMLEILPEGCSKAMGVTKLCEELGIDPTTQLLAIGDAENDVEMLRLAAIGVAVWNANDMAKEAADAVVPLTSCEGGAGLTIETMLKKRDS
jgi:hydroxymethylpyrimidine pyrophosphatase-like HAD family hydrolase